MPGFPEGLPGSEKGQGDGCKNFLSFSVIHRYESVVECIQHRQHQVTVRANTEKNIFEGEELRAVDLKEQPA